MKVSMSNGVKSSPGENSGNTMESSIEPLLCSANAQMPLEDPLQKVHVPVGRMIAFVQQIKVLLTGETNLKVLFAPTTIAAAIGFTIGMVPLLRHALIGDSAPLEVIESSVYLVGEACIPAMTLIVGANLLRGLRSSGVGALTVLGIIVVRYIALPLIGIGIVKAAHMLGLVGSDTLYQFILMLQFALPPAMSIGTICQLFEAGESECSIILMWSYAMAAFSLTLWSTFFMWMVA
ncbi:hypothetical protein SAY86_008828 [Trapa natans]|uniref:PIN-like protein n=1 Tax=Trapa natans TaxID=22666 RepID=A0AAN7KHU7_TRANT|nr:hypothetical protein SAY86_008828 [Trapa natans]